MTSGACRFCAEPLTETLVDLGPSPLANSFVSPANAAATETVYPLRAHVCSACRLVQLPQFEPPEHIFHDYLYYSSYSDSWLRHAERYAEAMVARLGLDSGSEVIEIASNDGYLLQYFHARQIRVLGVEPAPGPAAVGIAKGIPTETFYFGRAAAARLKAAGHAPQLVIANNVLPHVPDLNDFVAGLATLLAPTGCLTIELPHLLELIAQTQFDTIYHEHLSYFSLLTAERVFAHHGLVVVDVEELPTHGGSLRLFLAHADRGIQVTPNVAAVRQREIAAGLDGPDAYRGFAARTEARKRAVVDFLQTARRDGKTVLAYGAPAKGNTLLNYCGVTTELIPFTVDRNPHKQGLLLPGTHLPIRDPAALRAARPDYVFILPWNLRDEVMAQLADIRIWGGAFVVSTPELQILR
ncbi:class I SAM-dependent methyltransferase [Bradyrhizobium jicamae]|uniref:class I SAM-dependent methyltransferase n=1 Tax=Bradyrhizobium jicamae TaxID=280332 RepID=UPI001BACCDED|nr:class I SAM-dependent methyltransferase [Bradyrhizobium jicamae]MBR0753816.1 class I SAM-dependent methyltransferase [Bradyrhizobium jicamae]